MPDLVLYAPGYRERFDHITAEVSAATGWPTSCLITGEAPQSITYARRWIMALADEAGIHEDDIATWLGVEVATVRNGWRFIENHFPISDPLPHWAHTMRERALRALPSDH